MRVFFSFYYIPLFLFFSLGAQANPPQQLHDAMIVNSGEAHYDGKGVVLTGQVVVEHPIGQISAHHLTVLPTFDHEKKSKFALLKICEDVHIRFKGGGQLSCQKAEVDLSKMQGVFLANEEHPDVVFLSGDEKEGVNERVKPFVELKSLGMTLELSKEPAQAFSSSKTIVKQIIASQNVRVYYNGQYLLLADHAQYLRIADDKSSIAGLLTLTVKDNLAACTMTNLNADRLYAHKIELNTQEGKLRLYHVEGKLNFDRVNSLDQMIEFSAGQLLWDDQQEQLLLRENVEVTQNQSLKVTTSGEILISQVMCEGRRTFKFLRSPQDTQISYFDAQNKQMARMHCPGPLVIDHEAHQMTLEGLIYSQNGETKKEQVYIEGVMGDMYADFVDIFYGWNDKELVAEKLVLEGNVQLMNRFAGQHQQSESVLHYALADRLECFPKSHEMILTSDNGGRVLFLDKANNIQMSAPSLKLRHDPLTKKDAIQGVGDVRFTFIEKEIEQLKNRFSFQKELLDGKSSKKK